MISNITHELKTPLAVIHSYAEGLQEGIAGEHQDRYLDVILEETDQMDGMVLEMLDLSRLEAGKVRLASDRFSLLELTKAVFDKLDPLMQEKKLKVEFLWPQDFQITADEARLAQVVTNLATNAIKYSPEGGMINVQIFQHNGRCHFTIENQSEPIPEENLKKLWDSFYRTDASRTEKGTGLGLTITKTIVELHGGTCAARNTPNGVQFEFELP
jgi:signal transduction histidine kinase